MFWSIKFISRAERDYRHVFGFRPGSMGVSMGLTLYGFCGIDGFFGLTSRTPYSNQTYLSQAGENALPYLEQILTLSL